MKNYLRYFLGFKSFTLLLLAFLLVNTEGMAQTSGDFRVKNATSTWSTTADWETYNGSTWVNATAKPDATNTVYIPQNKAVTLIGNEACKDLHINTHANSALNLGINTLQINGKLRAYSGNSEPGTNDNPALRNDWITSTTGKISIVGNNRNLTNANEWGATNAGVASPNGFDLEINLNSGQTVTLGTNIKARNMTIVSGILDAGTNRLSPDQGSAGTGILTIESGATLVSAASGASNQVISRTTTASSLIGTLNLVSGGTLRLTGGSPIVEATTINLNGTVEYTSSSSQTFVPAFTTYTNLIVANSAKTASGNITINNTFQINQGGFASGGTWTYGSGATLIYNNTSNAYGPIDNLHSYWPATNGPTNVTVQGAGGINLGVSRTVSGTFQTVAGITISGGALTLNGICQINGGGFFNNSPTYGSNSTLIYNTGTAFTNSSEWTTSSSVVGSGAPKNIIIQNTGTNLSLAAYRSVIGNLTISNGATLSLSTSGHNLDLYGDFTQNGTIVSNNSTIIFRGDAATQTINASSGNVNLNAINTQKNGGVLRLGNTNVTLTATPTALTMANSTVFELNGKNLISTGMNAGSNTSIISNVSGGKVIFNASSQINTCASCLSIGSNITVELNADVNFGSSTTTINGVLQIKNGGSVNTNPPIYGSSSTLIYNAGSTFTSGSEWRINQITGRGVPQNVEINSGTILSFGTETGYRQANGNITINSGGTFTLSTGTGGDVKLGGNWTNNGTFTPNNRAVFFVGASGNQQIFKAGSSPEVFDFLIIDKMSGNVELAINTTCNQTLTLTAGKIRTYSYKVISTGTVDRTNGYVFGNFQKPIPTGATTRTFEVGDESNYSPLSIAFENVTTAGNITAVGAGGAHPSTGNNTFILSTSKFINRYWVATNVGTVFDNYAITLTFAPGNIVNGANTAALKMGKWDGSTWTYPTVSSNTATTAKATGLTSFSEFFLAEELSTITTGTITGSPFCVGAAVSVPYTSTGSFTGTFTAQLSDASGSFASPVPIGTGTSPISAIIPMSTLSGTGYRIRVINTTPNIIGSDNGANLTVNALIIDIKAFLAGPLDAATGKMSDALRTLPAFPTTSPYGGGETIAPSVLQASQFPIQNNTNDDIVDWVEVQLRTSPIASPIKKAALIQRDGDIVDLDGVSLLSICVAAGNYHVAVLHRNHLGVMTLTPLSISNNAVTTVDFRSALTDTYGTNAQRTMGSYRAMWAGNVNEDKTINYFGTGTDRTSMRTAIDPNIELLNVYNKADLNMDGKVLFSGKNNDRQIILKSLNGETSIIQTF